MVRARNPENHALTGWTQPPRVYARSGGKAPAALQRLQETEERAHARLLQAIEGGNLFQIKSCQEFYLRSSETLRRLDLAIDTERRKTEDAVTKESVENAAQQISNWLRIGFEQFLSCKSPALMRVDDVGSFKFHAAEKFREILHAVTKSELKSSSIPSWAAAKVIEAWNVPSF